MKHCKELSWQQGTDPFAPAKNRPKMTVSEKIQRANCALKVKEYRKPTDTQKYLFVNDKERVGALRRTFLKNGLLVSSNIGKDLISRRSL